MTERKIYGCSSILDQVKMKSSSGGIFYLLAEMVIIRGGLVYAVRFNNQWEVEHACCKEIDQLKNFMGSKYVQSNKGNSFREIKKNLDENRQVLFCGTPCEVTGLTSFLGRRYENLLTVDLICHGVPSPRVWSEYLYAKSKGDIIESINFRDKSSGWDHEFFTIKYGKGNIWKEHHRNNTYMKGYLSNIFLRPACYTCYFKGLDRPSDLTLGDFWKVNVIAPEIYNSLGTSLVIVHSNSGNDYFSGIKDKLIYKEIDESCVIESNPYAFVSVPRPPQRDLFFQRAYRNVEWHINKYSQKTILERIYYKVKSLFNNYK